MTETRETSPSSAVTISSSQRTPAARRFIHSWLADEELVPTSPIARRMAGDEGLRLMLAQDMQAELLDNVVRLRLLRGLTQAQLAEKMGSTQSVISRIERGSSNPRASTIEKLAEVLHAAIRLELVPFEDYDTQERAPRWWARHAAREHVGTSVPQAATAKLSEALSTAYALQNYEQAIASWLRTMSTTDE